jgi:NADH dehydrogenase
VANYDGVVVTLSDGTSIPSATLIWTAGVKPSPVIESLPCQKEHGRLLVNEDMSVPGVSGLWAAGDCAAIPDVKNGAGKLAMGRVRPTGGFYPPTAQHGLREGVIVARNIEGAILGRPLRPFRFKMLGMLASIGHHTGVAMVFGIKFSGFIAWWFWRSVYLMKLPRLAKKLRVMASWTLDIFFGQEIEQMITIRDIETLNAQLERIRVRAKHGSEE